MTIVARYPGECTKCRGRIYLGDSIEWEKGNAAYHSHCPRVPITTHASGDFGLSKRIGTHEFKPDASVAPAGESCARCGTKLGIAWIAGAGEYLCYRHQDDY